MNKQRAKKQTLTIGYNAPFPVNIGDVFYFLQPIALENSYFNKETWFVPGLSTDIHAWLHHFEVHRYEINSIECSLPFSKNPTPEIHLRLMHYIKYQNGKRGYDNSRSYCLKNFIKTLNVVHEDCLEAVFDDYELAIAEAEKRNKLIKDNLAEFNAKFGTDFALNFNAIEPDPK